MDGHRASQNTSWAHRVTGHLPVTGSPHCAAHATCHLRRAGSHLGPGGLIALRTCVQWTAYWTASPQHGLAQVRERQPLPCHRCARLEAGRCDWPRSRHRCGAQRSSARAPPYPAPARRPTTLWAPGLGTRLAARVCGSLDRRTPSLHATLYFSISNSMSKLLSL